MNKFYITTAIAYVNGRPHMGHALEFIFTDIINRYHTLKAEDTYFLTGTDDHGSKIYKLAKDTGVDVSELVEENIVPFIEICDTLNLSNDAFIRTSSDVHKRGAQKIWKMLEESGDIYTSKYEGLYCVGCEAYVLEKDLVDGKCPNHMKEPERLEEENYFFKLSKYSDQIRELIESDELKIFPESRKNEMLSLLDEGLTDVSFSRPKSSLPWGVDVPGDDDQVMYVWCDALSNYITALGFADGHEYVDRYWPADMHVIGKDILRFHAGIWIGMLLSAGLPVPKSIGVHGFLTCEGKKMSKSIGNVIDPVELVDDYGIDAVRYYFAREVPTGDDGDYSEDRFKTVYLSELANNYGNLVNRVLVMLGKYLDSKVPEVNNFVFEEDFAEVFNVYSKGIESFDLKRALEAVVKFLDKLNAYVEETKPWLLAKNEDESLPEVLGNLLEGVRLASLLLWPYVPETVEKVFSAMGYELQKDFEKDISNRLSLGSKVGELAPLFPRLEN